MRNPFDDFINNYNEQVEIKKVELTPPTNSITTLADLEKEINILKKRLDLVKKPKWNGKNAMGNKVIITDKDQQL